MAGNRDRYQRAVSKGLAFNANERWKEAIAAFRIAVAEFPREADPYAGLGEACFQLKQLDKALDCYKLAARYSGGNIIFMRKVADLQERMGRLEDASRTYMAAGELLLRRRQLDDAISNWERAVRLAPGLLGAHQRLAMIFQRQGDTRGAVREYLAIARTLQLRGEKSKALRMCQAALRLDPGNEDILTAIDLVQFGEEAFPEPKVEPVTAPVAEPPVLDEEEQSLFQTVRQMANVLESEKSGWSLPHRKEQDSDPISVASRQAQELLAAEIFRDEEDESLLYGTKPGVLSKLERDALIGQGIDFHARGKVSAAIDAYEKAVAGGLSLPAVHFTLGMLYVQSGRSQDAIFALSIAAADVEFYLASQHLLTKLD